MPFEFVPLGLEGVLLVRPQRFDDERGSFMELYRQSAFAAAGILDDFRQDNVSHSVRGVLRGLHFQSEPAAQAKLVRVVSGEIYDVVLDMRAASAGYGKWIALTLSAEEPLLVYVPAGFAHGFCTLSEAAEVSYKTSCEYSPADEGGVIWDDPDLAIPWPIREPLLSPRDRTWPTLRSLTRADAKAS